MKICAVICEYNPFHFGHAYLISEMKKRGAVVAVMSGSFTQRGEPAVISKYERARAALLGGADLVLELPFPYSSSCAERFASAGTDIVSALGCVDELCFGSEAGNIDSLWGAAERTASSAFADAVKSRLSEGHGISYRSTVSEVYKKLYGAELCGGSNDILAISYLARLNQTASSVRPVAVKRIGEAYDGSGEGLPSASTVRKMLVDGDFDAVSRSVPSFMGEMLRSAAARGGIADGEKLFPIFAGLVRSGREEIFGGVPDMTAELSARLRMAALHARDEEELLSMTETKRYSRSRIRRGILYTLLGVKAENLAGACYTTVLAANETGREILSSVRRSARIPVVTKPADYRQYGETVRRAFELSARADSIWELLCAAPRDGAAMMREKPVFL